MKNLLIIPTYNERENLPRLIQKIRALKLELDVLVIDDASPDGSGALVRQLCRTNPWLHLIERGGKLGLGTAYLEGFRYALRHGAKRILESDADFSHDPADLVRLLAAPSSVDVVLGSRYIPGGKILGWSWERKLLSKLANLLARGILGLKSHDVTSGFKCYSRRFIQSLDFKKFVSPTYAFQVETIYYAEKGHFRIQEIPIIFRDRALGESKVSGREIGQSAKSILRLALRRRGVRQAVKFGLVGSINFALDLLILNILVLAFGWNVYSAGAVAIAVAMVNSFLWNKYWTFRGLGRQRLQVEATQFFTVNSVGALFNYLAYSALIHFFGLWYNWAKLLAIIVSSIWNFTGSKYWVFKHE